MKRNDPQSKPQLFIIADEVWQNSDVDELNATSKDMMEMGIFYPPCQHFEILISARFIPYMMEKGMEEKLPEHLYNSHYKNNFFRLEIVVNDMEDWQNSATAELMYIDPSDGQWVGVNWLNNKNLIEGKLTKEKWEKKNRDKQNTISYMSHLLLVTLATKNVERKSKPNLMAKQALRSKALKRDYEYTTTLTIGKVVGAERTEGDAGGWKVRPHLRRGHIREQRYGPNNQLLKKVFIQPVFVNAADGVMSQRRAYNVRVA